MQFWGRLKRKEIFSGAYFVKMLLKCANSQLHVKFDHKLGEQANLCINQQQFPLKTPVFTDPTLNPKKGPRARLKKCPTPYLKMVPSSFQPFWPSPFRGGGAPHTSQTRCWDFVPPPRKIPIGEWGDTPSCKRPPFSLGSYFNTYLLFHRMINLVNYIHFPC